MAQIGIGANSYMITPSRTPPWPDRQCQVSSADGHAEREVAKVMINAGCEAAGDATISITLGADR